MKRTLLDDFIKIYNSIQCDYEYCSCVNCSNNYICDIVRDVINSITKYYYKSTRN